MRAFLTIAILGEVARAIMRCIVANRLWEDKVPESEEVE
jgi:hypothetical protein